VKAASFLDDLERGQREVAGVVSELEAALARARSGRLAPIPAGDVGRRGIRREGGRFPPSPRIEVPEAPKRPAELEAAVFALAGGGQRTKPPREPSRAVESPPGALAAPGSLVHERVVVGNRRAIEVIAAVRVRLVVDGRPGIRDLFPGFDPGDAIAFDVEVTCHEVGPVASGDDGGLNVAAVTAGMVAGGWPFRAWPWTASVKRSLERDLALPSGFSSRPANPRAPGPDGGLFAGDAFVILALDPASGQEQELLEPGARDGRRESRDGDDGIAKAVAAERPGPEQASALERARSSPLEEPVPGASFERSPEALAEDERRSRPGEGPAAAVTAEDCLQMGIGEESAGGAAGYGASARPAVPAKPPDSPRPAEAFPALRFTGRRLRWKFKHAPEFGVHERYGRSALASFRAAVERHVETASARRVGRLGGEPLVAHVARERVVWTTADGSFVTCYRASPDQLRYLWSRPEWSPS